MTSSMDEGAKLDPVSLGASVSGRGLVTNEYPFCCKIVWVSFSFAGLSLFGPAALQSGSRLSLHPGDASGQFAASQDDWRESSTLATGC